jgi:hypothetical protein
MSQVLFRGVLSNNTPVEVMAGWDHPLQHFYLTIFDLSEDAEEETVWSTIAYPNTADSKGTARLRAKLVEMGLRAPPTFWELVEKKEGNAQYHLSVSS